MNVPRLWSQPRTTLRYRGNVCEDNFKHIIFPCFSYLYERELNIKLFLSTVQCINFYYIVYPPAVTKRIAHWNFWGGGRIDFCVESYWVIESSRIKYLQDSRPESFWYYSTIHRTWWKISRWKKRVAYYFPSRWKKIYLI